VGAFAPVFGALGPTNYTPMLGAPMPEKSWLYPIEHSSYFTSILRLHRCSSRLRRGPYRRDLAETWTVGNTVYFAVNVPGELLSMGDGEISDAAIEVPLGARLQVSLVKGQRSIRRFENDDAIMSIGRLPSTRRLPAYSLLRN